MAHGQNNSHGKLQAPYRAPGVHHSGALQNAALQRNLGYVAAECRGLKNELVQFHMAQVQEPMLRGEAVKSEVA